MSFVGRKLILSSKLEVLILAGRATEDPFPQLPSLLVLVLRGHFDEWLGFGDRAAQF